MKKTAVITGSAGFIGQGLAGRLAAQNWTVVGFDARAHDLPGVDSTAVIGDIRSAQDLQQAFDIAGKPDVVIHGGGVSGSMVLRNEPATVAEINIGGTVAVLEESRRRKVGRLVFCSSIMAYGPTAQGPVRELAPLVPANVYGATKAAGEALVHSYVAEFGLQAVQLRIAHVYGPGRTTTCPLHLMLEAAVQGHPVVLEAAEDAQRQFIHVTDVLDAIDAAVHLSDRGSYVVNIGPGHAQTLGAVAAMVRDTVGPLDIRFADQASSADYETGALSIDRAQSLLGWRPRISLVDGIRDFARSF